MEHWSLLDLLAFPLTTKEVELIYSQLSVSFHSEKNHLVFEIFANPLDLAVWIWSGHSDALTESVDSQPDTPISSFPTASAPADHF